jgi:hypothetical protein
MKVKAPKEEWIYGRSPNPRTWFETADVLKRLEKKRTKPKASPLLTRLDAIERLVREKK